MFSFVDFDTLFPSLGCVEGRVCRRQVYSRYVHSRCCIERKYNRELIVRESNEEMQWWSDGYNGKDTTTDTGDDTQTTYA